MNEFEDIDIVCLCGKKFTWTIGEQQFLQKLIDDGKTNRDGSEIIPTQPKRCKECRRRRKEERMRNENPGNYRTHY